MSISLEMVMELLQKLNSKMDKLVEKMDYRHSDHNARIIKIESNQNSVQEKVHESPCHEVRIDTKQGVVVAPVILENVPIVVEVVPQQLVVQLIEKENAVFAALQENKKTITVFLLGSQLSLITAYFSNFKYAKKLMTLFSYVKLRKHRRGRVKCVKVFRQFAEVPD